MSSAASDASQYSVPGGKIGLKGPVARPAPGTLPLRGDLAHIALAGTHLAAHYVIPKVQTVGADGADVRESNRDDSPVTTRFEAGTRVEILDIAGQWAWGCLGPEGPSGYIKVRDLAD